MKQPKQQRSTRISQDELLKDDLVFKALSNRDRRTMLDHVREQPRSTSDFCELLSDLDRCTVMLHLRILEQAELLITRKEGRNKWHYLNVVPFQKVYERWIKAYAQPAATFLTQLARQFEEPATRPLR